MTSRSQTAAKLVCCPPNPCRSNVLWPNHIIVANPRSSLPRRHCRNARQLRAQSTFTAAVSAVQNAFSGASKKDPFSLNVGDPLRTVAKELKFQVKNLRELVGSGHPALDTVAKYYTRSEGKYVRVFRRAKPERNGRGVPRYAVRRRVHTQRLLVARCSITHRCRPT